MMENNDAKIEVGYGIAKGSCSFEVGKDAAMNALKNINKYSISSVIIYASVEYELKKVLQGAASVIGDKLIFGTTTAGEICNDAYNKSVLVVILASPYLRVKCGIGSNVSKDWNKSLEQALDCEDIKPFFENIGEFSRKIKLEGKNIFIMLFSPGNTKCTPSYSFDILESLKTRSLGLYPIIGGASADDWQMIDNYVFYGKEAYKDSVLVAVFETELQFGISLTHGFKPTDIKTTVTSVDGSEILTLDNSPALNTLSKLVNVPEEELATKHFALTTGYVFGIPSSMEQYSVNTASYFTKREGLLLTGKVTPGTVITMMRPDLTDTLTAGTEAIRKAIIQGGINDIAICFSYYCALRPKLIGEEYKKEISDMTQMLYPKPHVGFFSFGEQGLGADGVSRHNNTAIGCLILGNGLSQISQVALENKRLLNEVKKYDQLKNEFITNISHELRTPINVIFSTLQLIELKEKEFNYTYDNEKIKEYFKIMKQNCYRLIRLSNNLIDISKIESGYVGLNLNKDNIVQVVEDITLSVAAYIKDKGFHIMFDTNVEEKNMEFDAEKLERIMLNLLSNAVKFSKPGDTISVYLEDNIDYIKIFVKDTGVGIPKEKQKLVFERFRQLDSSLARKNEGSGIGLSLVKNLVALHNGKISINSDYGKGAEFIVELPVNKLEDNTELKCTHCNNYSQKIILEFSDIY